LLYLEDSDEGGVPWALQTSVIGHPTQNLSYSVGYEYLSEGRCWLIGSLDKDAFHFVPLSIPPTATFLGNSTINGDMCSQWTWKADVDNVVPLEFILVVRYGDNAPLYFVIINSFFINFRITIRNSRFYLNPAKSYFDVPPGPCANKSWNFEVPPTTSSRTSRNGFEVMSNFLVKQLVTAYTAQSGFMGILQGNFQQKKQNKIAEQDPEQVPAPAPGPVPPSLHQFFQSDYEIGYGELKAADGFKPPNSLFRGNMAVDKVSGGFYVNIDDNQDADVPFLFSTNVILHPNPTGVVGYWFLRPGRCWLTAFPIVNPDFPIQIPPNATLVGSYKIYGNEATLWEFDGSLEGYGAAIQIAVSSADNKILFITLSPDYQDLPLGTYLIFSNFNASQPDPATYGVPPGHCWDPLTTGPGTK